MFRIGEFSQIAQLPTSQLRYYDEIGLLKPAHIDEWTNYRYYSVTQLARLNRILALRELGLTLEQIRRLLDDKISAEEIRGMFRLRKAQIEQQLQDEIVRLRTVEARLQHLEVEGELGDYDVVVKSLPAQPYIAVRVHLDSLFDAFDIVKEMQQRLPAVVGKQKMDRLTVLFHSSFFKHEDVEVTLGWALHDIPDDGLTLSNGLVATVQELPAVEMVASTIREGGPENNIHTHSAIGRWAEANGYRLAGQGREVVIRPPRTRTDRREMVTEIQLPVARGDE